VLELLHAPTGRRRSSDRAKEVVRVSDTAAGPMLDTTDTSN